MVGSAAGHTWETYPDTADEAGTLGVIVRFEPVSGPLSDGNSRSSAKSG